MLEHLFGSKTRVKLLQIFFGSPGRPFFGRELSRLSGTQLNAVRREIANLAALQIIAPKTQVEVGAVELGHERSKFFQLNMGCLLYPELRELLLKAAVIEEEAFVQSIQERAGKISLLLLTGLFTSETDVDTDLLIVGSVKPKVLAKLIKAYEKDSGRSLRYTIMDPKEFKERRSIGDKFLYRIFEAKHTLPIDEFELS